MAIVTQPFKTLRRRLSVCAPVVPSGDLEPHTFNDVLKRGFIQEPKAQLWGAIGAVFESWMNQRANTYRRLHNIPESWGTAVNVQAMVFRRMFPETCRSRRPSPNTTESNLMATSSGVLRPSSVGEGGPLGGGATAPSPDGVLPVRPRASRLAPVMVPS